MKDPRHMSRKSADWFGFANGAYPQSRMYVMMPRDQRSTAVPYGLPCRISGAT